MEEYFKVQYIGGNHSEFGDLSWGHDETNHYKTKDEAQKRIINEKIQDIEHEYTAIKYRIIKVTVTEEVV